MRLSAALTPLYPSVAAEAVPDERYLFWQDRLQAAPPGWFSCWLPLMAPEADPPVAPFRLDR
jgi:hypothetical protein